MMPFIEPMLQFDHDAYAARLDNAVSVDSIYSAYAACEGNTERAYANSVCCMRGNN